MGRRSLSQDQASQLVDANGEDLDVRIAPDARLDGPIRIRGRRNRLIVSEGVRLDGYVPSGLSVFEHDPGETPRSGLVIEGEDNSVEILAGARLGVNLTVLGSGNHVVIGPACNLRGLMNLLGSGARLSIGAGSTMVQGSLQLHEAGEIRIGADCMISSQVYVSLSDMHPIYDRASGTRINPPASIDIGDHVWLGLRCMVLKGARIGDGAVVAAGAMVTDRVPSNSIAAGAPARVLRENIEWCRDFSQGGPEPQAVVSTAAPRSFWRAFRRPRALP